MRGVGLHSDSSISLIGKKKLQEDPKANPKPHFFLSPSPLPLQSQCFRFSFFSTEILQSINNDDNLSLSPPSLVLCSCFILFYTTIQPDLDLLREQQQEQRKTTVHPSLLCSHSLLLVPLLSVYDCDIFSRVRVRVMPNKSTIVFDIQFGLCCTKNQRRYTQREKVKLS